MPLAGPGLAAAFTGAGADPTKSGSLGLAMSTWLVANCQILPGTMTAAGGAVTGQGAITFTGSANDFGDHLAASIPATDAAGIAKWRGIAGAIRNHMQTQGYVDPSGFTVPMPSGGPLGGVGALQFVTLVMSPTMSSILGVTDAANVSAWDSFWTGISYKLLKNMQDNATVPPLGLTAPPAGAVTGVGTIL